MFNDSLVPWFYFVWFSFALIEEFWPNKNFVIVVFIKDTTLFESKIATKVRTCLQTKCTLNSGLPALVWSQIIQINLHQILVVITFFVGRILLEIRNVFFDIREIFACIFDVATSHLFSSRLVYLSWAINFAALHIRVQRVTNAWLFFPVSGQLF